VDKDFYAEYFEIEDRHWWFVGRRRIFTRLLDEALAPAPAGGRRILDFGCGTGTMLGHLARYGEAHGVDFDPEAVRFCALRGVERVQLVTEGRLPFADATFDLVTALDVLEHIDDDVAAVAEIRRVLRPGGLLLASVPAYRFLWGAQDEISHHKRRYVARELRASLTGGGLAVQRVSYFNTLLFPPIAAIRILRPYRPGSADLRSDFGMTRAGRLNEVLARLFSLEQGLVARLRLPFGVSLLALAVRPAA
jgi:SAM-dependent methyltransferase